MIIELFILLLIILLVWGLHEVLHIMIDNKTSKFANIIRKGRPKNTIIAENDVEWNYIIDTLNKVSVEANDNVSITITKQYKSNFKYSIIVIVPEDE